MTTANKITIFRVVLIPVFLVLAYTGHMRWALVVFVLASLSDMLDGYIARHYNQITNFGKFMDPLADKVLVCSAMICLVEINPDMLPAWAVIIIIAREFIISGFRLVASDAGIVIAASGWGEGKTVSQMVMVILMLANIRVSFMPIVISVVMYIAVALTVISLIDYIWKNKGVLADR